MKLCLKMAEGFFPADGVDTSRPEDGWDMEFTVTKVWMRPKAVGDPLTNYLLFSESEGVPMKGFSFHVLDSWEIVP